MKVGNLNAGPNVVRRRFEAVKEYFDEAEKHIPPREGNLFSLKAERYRRMLRGAREDAFRRACDENLTFVLPNILPYASD